MRRAAVGASLLVCWPTCAFVPTIGRGRLGEVRGSSIGSAGMSTAIVMLLRKLNTVGHCSSPSDATIHFGSLLGGTIREPSLHLHVCIRRQWALMRRPCQAVNIDAALVRRNDNSPVRHHGRTKFTEFETVARNVIAVPKQLKARSAVGIRMGIKFGCIIGAKNSVDYELVRVPCDRGKRPNNSRIRVLAIRGDGQYATRHSALAAQSCRRDFGTLGDKCDIARCVDVPGAQALVFSPV